MKYYKFSLFFGLMCMIIGSASAQYENHQMIMGERSAGIHFDLKTNEPIPHTLHSELDNESGCVATHPSTGQLLFYTDGDTIYNALNRIMLGGDGLFSEHCISSASSAVAMPKPGYEDQFYLFSNPFGLDCTNAIILLSTIDMTLDDGLGAVISTIELPYEIGEGMVAIPKPNSSNYWLVTTGRPGSQATHYVLRIDETGVNLASTYQFELTTYPSFNLNYHPPTQQLCTIFHGNIDEIRLSPFDSNSGSISNHTHSVPLIDGFPAYDVELSSDGSKVYYSRPSAGAQIYQYDINTENNIPITTPATNSSIRGGGLFTGPDHNIYHIHNEEATSLSIIQNPNGIGVNCNYYEGGLELNTKIGAINFLSTMAINPPVVSDTVRGIINEYANVISLCGNSFIVDDAAAFSVGDTILIIQMQGVDINTSNTSEFGSITDYGQAGKNEFNTIQSINGNEIIFDKVLVNEYDANGSVQIVSVPYLGDAVLDGVTCYPWNGNIGGVLVFTGGEITLTDDIDVSGRGFRGGQMMNIEMERPYFPSNGYFYPDVNLDFAGRKGEGVFILPFDFSRAKGAAANAGGGGNNHNNGAGGGSNFGRGGRGGYWDGNPEEAWSNRGYGGKALNYSPNEARFFMGGGGGAGHSNNYFGTSGGTGGGIVIIKAKSIITNDYTIKANGESSGKGRFRDGGGGGGAGGSITLFISSNNTPYIEVEAFGGRGSSVRFNHGHGGGGGGGILLLDNYPTGGILFNALGGLNGKGTNGDNNLATNGESGNLKTQFSIPFSTDQYQILSLIDLETSSQCDSTGTIHVSVLGTGIQFSIDNGEWVNDTLFQELSSGEYNIKISNGCSELEETVILHNYPNVFGEILFNDPVICDSLGVIEVLALEGKSPFTYELIGRPNSQDNGVFGQLNATTYQYSITDDRGCLYQQSFNIEDQSYNIYIDMTEDTSMFKYDTIQLPHQIIPFAPPYDYDWQSEWNLQWINCDTCPNPKFYPEYSTDIILKVTDGFGCTGEVQTHIDVTDVDIYFPNVFSPNGDGINDFIYPQTKEGAVKQLKSMRIFNRWGSLVFETTNQPVNTQSIGWNGMSENKQMEGGVYVVIYEIELNNGAVINGIDEFILLR